MKSKAINYIELASGTVLKEKYLIKKKLVKRSNLSIVYLAINTSTREKVVIKEFFPDQLVLRDLDATTVVAKNSANKSYFQQQVDSFLQEGQIMQQINSCYIADCYDFFRENNTAYLVIKYYQGTTLKDYLVNNLVTLESFLDEIFYPLLKAVAIIHKQGYIHRDIKPDNILYANKTVLIDFGSAINYRKAKKIRKVLTPGYSPLEFHSIKSVQGQHSDIYSLAAILYYFLTGQSPIAVKKRIIEDSLAPVIKFNSNVSQGLNNIIMRNLSLDFKKRDQTINSFRLNLQAESFKIKSKKMVNSFFKKVF